MRGGRGVRAGRREGLWCGGGTQEACTHGDVAQLKAWGPRARAERTANMKSMSVTLEVSTLSGWLKADAYCRVEGRACDAGGERCEPGGGRACGVVAAHKRRARGWPDSRPVGGKGTRGERTWNMRNMVVTLEVSKLSGWLKADAYCRVEGGHAMRGGEVRAGRREGPGGGGGTTSGMHGEKARLKACGGQGHARSAPGTCRAWS